MTTNSHYLTYSIYFSLKGLGECTLWSWEWSIDIGIIDHTICMILQSATRIWLAGYKQYLNPNFVSSKSDCMIFCDVNQTSVFVLIIHAHLCAIYAESAQNTYTSRWKCPSQEIKIREHTVTLSIRDTIDTQAEIAVHKSVCKCQSNIAWANTPVVYQGFQKNILPTFARKAEAEIGFWSSHKHEKSIFIIFFLNWNTQNISHTHRHIKFANTWKKKNEKRYSIHNNDWFLHSPLTPNQYNNVQMIIV